MKTIFLTVLTLFIQCQAFADNDIINKLKEFCQTADMDCYIEKIEKNAIENFLILRRIWDDTITPPPDIDLHSENAIPLLSFQFVDTDSFTFADNIYDYIAIDSAWCFVFACVDKKQNVKVLIDAFDYKVEDSQYLKKMKKVIREIKKQKPDLLLYSSTLSMGFGWFNNPFGYIKGDKIFIYNMDKKRSYELNYYITFLKLEQARKLNRSYIPRLYDKEIHYRKSGNTPESEIMICPPLSVAKE